MATESTAEWVTRIRAELAAREDAMTTEPTTAQETEYDRMLAAGADPDVSAYLTGIDECHCVMPWQSCRICRGSAKMRNAESDLTMLLETSTSVEVTIIRNLIVVTSDSTSVVVDDFDTGIQALIDSGHYREHSQHVGGRTLERHIAEPVEGAATGPTFTRDHPESWKVVEQ